MDNGAKLTRQEAFAMIAEVFEEPEDSIAGDRKIDTIDAWDSMGILTFMAELDSQFGIAVSANEFSQIKTVNDILTLLQKNNVLA